MKGIIFSINHSISYTSMTNSPEPFSFSETTCSHSHTSSRMTCLFRSQSLAQSKGARHDLSFSNNGICDV